MLQNVGDSYILKVSSRIALKSRLPKVVQFNQQPQNLPSGTNGTANLATWVGT
jgi:hypothetical protein